MGFCPLVDFGANSGDSYSVGGLMRCVLRVLLVPASPRRSKERLGHPACVWNVLRVTPNVAVGYAPDVASPTLRHFTMYQAIVKQDGVYRILLEPQVEGVYVNVFASSGPCGPCIDLLADSLKIAMEMCEEDYGVKSNDWTEVPDEFWHGKRS